MAPDDPYTPTPQQLSSRRTLGNLAAEGLVIVVSVLVALYAESWREHRVEIRAAEAQLVSLARDFAQMSARADTSLWNARNAVETGEVLLGALMGPNPETIADSAMAMLLTTVQYEVFSPSTGAYDALVSSGNIELLSDIELKRALSDFFGSFEDVKASETMLLNGQRDFFNSPGYHELIGARRMARLREDPSISPDLARQWSQSASVVDGLFNSYITQTFVLEDYEFLRQSIDRIQALLPEAPGEAASASPGGASGRP
jgi:hypothetical protein